MADTKICKKCGILKPITPQFFNLLPSGNWRGTCKECMAANSRKHHHEYPEKTAQRRARYNANQKAAEGEYSQVDIEKIRLTLKDKCFYCSQPLNGGGEKDHMTPLSKGGTNWPDNITLACLTCNRDKHDKTAKEFFEWRSQRNLPIRIRSLINL